MSWLQKLKDYAEQHPIVVLRFSSDKWETLANSRRGVGEFTVALPHALVSGVKAQGGNITKGANHLAAVGTTQGITAVLY